MSSHLFVTDAIIEWAEVISGTRGLVDQAMRERVEKMAASFRDMPGMTPGHAHRTHRQIATILARRLTIASDVLRFPEILDEKVESPVFVVGFGRTGTTLLQSLLGSDPQHRPVAAWRVREPSPPPGAGTVTEYRRERAAVELERFVERCPGFLAFHPYFDNGADTTIEDEEIFLLDFRNFYPSLLYEAPSLAIDISVEDGVATYEFLKLFMQHQQWRQPKKRWVMKGVAHQRQFPALLKVFPDAKCIWVHRDPDSLVPSTLALASVIYGGIATGSIDCSAVAQGFSASFQEELAELINDPGTRDPRIFHASYERFVADQVALLRDAYGRWGFDFTEETEKAMRGWLADDANRGDRYGKARYSYEDFGLDRATESAKYQSYRDYVKELLAAPVTA